MFRFLLTIFLILLFIVCENYEADSIVEFNLEYISQDTLPFNQFERNISKLLYAFSKENDDFKVKEKNNNSIKATHLISLKISKIELIEYNQYKNALDTASEQIEKSAKRIKYAPKPKGWAMTGLQNKIKQGLEKTMYSEYGLPNLTFELKLIKLDTKEDIINIKERIETYSNSPLTRKDQLSQLLSILNGKLREELPYIGDN
jgi:hypothetical protein